MKFRAKIVENHCIKQFINVVNLISKFAKMSVLRITADTIVFIVPDEQVIPHCIVVWAVLDKNGFFEQYDMVGVNALDANNEIFVEINIGLLTRILSNAKGASSIKIKLTHKTFPALTVDIEFPSQNSAESQQCIHEVPITVIPLAEWRDYKQPDIPKYDVVIESPPLRKVKNITDKLRQLGEQISISVSSNGTFSLGVNTIPAVVKTLFSDLTVDTLKSSKDTATALVEVKRLCQFLTCEQMNLSKVICSINSGNLIHWYLEQRGLLQLHYYLSTTVDD